MSRFFFMGVQEDPAFDEIEARGITRIYDGTKPPECVWCGEPNSTDTEVCSAKCAEEQAYADRMNEENAKADGEPARIGACPVCGETNKHVCREGK